VIIVGLGRAGCNIANTFSKYPQYTTYGIDTTEDATITIRPKKNHEDYDESFPNLRRKLKFSGEDVTVIIAGAGVISGGCLRLLEQLSKNKLTVVYIEGDISIMSEVQKKQEKIVSNVLQEYARSGMIESIIMISNSALEKSIGDMSIIGYYDTLNQAVANTIHMINVFKHSEPVIGNFIKPAEISRIATVGIVDISDEDEKNHKENWFYPLTGTRDVVYYYGINEKDLKNDGTLFRKINTFVKSRIKDNMNVSYGVFRTSYEQKYCYCIKYTSMVQSYTQLLGDQDIS
tara:strand:+ start:5737 stop:6603 length:867 start_codon:yes stop_codon:yes gene_type:complete